MTTRIVHRPERTIQPLVGPGPRRIEAPPAPPGGQGGSNRRSAALAVAGMAGSLAMMTMFRDPVVMGIGAVLPAVAVPVGAGALLSRRGRAGRSHRARRERHLRALEDLRATLAGEEHEIRARARLLHPPPGALYDVVRDPARLWERRRRHPDFLQVRIGTGRVPAGPLVPDGPVGAPADPVLASAAEAAVRRFESMPDMPLAVSLDIAGDVSVIGARQDVMRLMRALLLQVAVFHAPGDVAVAVAHGGSRTVDWDWLKWLPHGLDPRRRAGNVEARLVAPSPPSLAAMLSADLRRRRDFAAGIHRGAGESAARRLMRRLLVVHDTHGEIAEELDLPGGVLSPRDLATTVIHLVADQDAEPLDVSVRMTVTGDQVRVEDLRGETPVVLTGTVDEVSGPMMTGFARTLAPIRLSPESIEEEALADGVDFASLMNVDDPGEPDLHRLWAPRTGRDFLRVPIGADEAGRPVLLDLKEAARLGMGPHGLCVGAAGSGRSEMLQALVLAFAASHPPDRLRMVLAGFGDGRTFAPLKRLPHVAAVITDPERGDGDPIERFHARLTGEVLRRQRLLEKAGGIADIGEYAYRRQHDPGLAPLPHLLVIIDGFDGLLAARPDFIEPLLSIGRLGHGIGVHLLLSAERIEEATLRGLDGHLSYRLALRTFSAQESRVVLGTPGAFHLPALPGFGYLKAGTGAPQRFRAGQVSVPHQGAATATREGDEPAASVLPYPAYNTAGAGRRPAAGTDPARSGHDTGDPALLDLLVDGITRQAGRMEDARFPPVPDVITLDTTGLNAGDPNTGDPNTGDPNTGDPNTGDPNTGDPNTGDPNTGPQRLLPYTVPGRSLPGPVQERHRVPIGIGERAFDPVLLDLFDHDRNLLVLGDGECGKTNLMRLIARGLTERYSPEQVLFAVMDPRGGLDGIVPEPYLGGYARSVWRCAGLAGGVAKELTGRMAGEMTGDGDRAPFAGGERWAGPRIVVFVDDYDQLATAGRQPLAPFLPFVPAGRDIGLHFVVTRRVAGAGQGMHDPLLKAIRELGTTALVMTGERSEGPLFPGVHAARRPPGRGLWIRRGRTAHLIQTALAEAP